MLHGQGSEQNWFTKEFQKKRQKGLLDRDKLTDEELIYYGITETDGGGRTNPEIWEVWQYPFPINSTIRKRIKVNLALLNKGTGEMNE
jgi:hypothetical protein